MFLIYALPLALLCAWVIGGRPLRVFEHPWRGLWLVWASIGIQVPLFGLGHALPEPAFVSLHVGSYVLLVAFMIRNRGSGLLLVGAGGLLNLAAIVANGGLMPIDAGAWAAAFPDAAHPSGGNAAVGSAHLWFLGDTMALPPWMPLTNVFSIGDVLLALGLVVLVCRHARSDAHVSRPPIREVISPLRLRPFRRFVFAESVSEVGDWMTVAALIAWVYDDRGTHLVAVALLVRTLPPAVLSPLAGAIADRLDRRMLMITTNLGRLVFVIGLATAVAIGSMVTALVCLGAAAALAAVHPPAAGAYLPSIVPRTTLLRANAILGLSGETAMVVGLSTGALIVLGIDPWLAIAADAVTFAVSAVTLSSLPPCRAAEPTPKSTVNALGQAVQHVLHTPALFAVVASFAAASFATGLVGAVLADHGVQALGFGSEGYGALMAALSLGLVLGHVVVATGRAGSARPVAVGVALAVMGVAFLVLADTGLATTALMAMVIGGVGDGVSDVLFQTSIQERTPERLVGRVFGIARFGVRGGIVLSAATVAFGLGTSAALWIAAGILLTAGVGVVVMCRGRERAEMAVVTT